MKKLIENIKKLENRIEEIKKIAIKAINENRFVVANSATRKLKQLDDELYEAKMAFADAQIEKNKELLSKASKLIK